jgi:hypothetical protein
MNKMNNDQKFETGRRIGRIIIFKPVQQMDHTEFGWREDFAEFVANELTEKQIKRLEKLFEEWQSIRNQRTLGLAD